MTKVRLCSGADIVRKFQKIGWTVSRQKGSHVMLVKEGFLYNLSVPQHREVGLGLVRKLIKLAGIGIEQFNEL